MFIILDSNVIISAFATEGLSYRVFQFCIDNLEIAISDEIKNECTKAFRKFKLSGTEIKTFQDILNRATKNFDLVGKPPVVCRDPKDNHVLHLAQISKAEYIITGDDDLLVLKKYIDCKIIKPRRFFEMVTE